MSLNFSDEQKVILMNQYSILEDLSLLKGDKKSADEYANARDGIRFGYGDWALTNVSAGMDNEVSEDDKEFVLSVLDMYSFIYGSYDKFDEAQKKEISLNDIMFVGFDGNEDTYGFYRFVTRQLGRYSEVVEFINKHGWDDNSHGLESSLPVMLRNYKKFNSSDLITADNNQLFEFVKSILGK